MFDRDYALTVAPTSTPVTRIEFDDSPPVPSFTKQTLPLSSHQAFAKLPIRSTAARRLVSARPRLLRHAGYEVATADSASTALQLAGERNFDLIISDIGMPGMNGYELAGTLRRLAEYQSIPMIAVTGYSEYDDRDRALQAGFSAHLTKPIDPSQLLDLMNQLLG